MGVQWKNNGGTFSQYCNKISTLCVLSCEETPKFSFFKTPKTKLKLWKKKKIGLNKHPKQNWSYEKRTKFWFRRKHPNQNWSCEGKKKPNFALKKNPQKNWSYEKTQIKETPKAKLKLWNLNQIFV